MLPSQHQYAARSTILLTFVHILLKLCFDFQNDSRRLLRDISLRFLQSAQGVIKKITLRFTFSSCSDVCQGPLKSHEKQRMAVTVQCK